MIKKFYKKSFSFNVKLYIFVYIIIATNSIKDGFAIFNIMMSLMKENRYIPHEMI